MAGANPAQIGAIHSIAKRAGLDEAMRRNLIASVAGGKTSCSQLTSGEAIAVIDKLRALQGGGGSAHRASGPYAAKLQALWLSGWNLGVVRDKSDAAMMHFIAGPAGRDHTRFLDPAAASRGIEAIKSMLAREGGVEWPERSGDVRASKLAVLTAQRRRLAYAGHVLPSLPVDTDEAAIDAAIRSGGAVLRKLLKRGRK